MAFGFGFNKAKVLATAEKNVQQGKLHNAITEYEKIVEKDPKDLTVLNTIGDLYARLGQTEKAGEFFRKVGDTYATEGFTVKAIAMYKKLTKLNPGAIATVQRLAELYTQQGLYNDARQQYLQLADSFIKSGDNNGATRVFQKMLEMDPDNVSLQSKLADLYVKTGKKGEARDIFLKAANSLYERGSVEQADEALNRMLALDPSNVDALLMRGKIALDAGNGPGAARYFEKVPNIDSRLDGLHSLLRAYILSSDAANAEGVARKIASVHNDLTGIRAYADYLLSAGNSEGALNVYDEFVDRLVVGDTGELTFALQGLTGQLKDSPQELEKLRNVFLKAGATANIPEVNELLAHACVKTGDLAQARDLYKELAELEPSNPQHMQNYRQVLTRMGEDATARPLAAAEGSQALYIEEIDAALPPLPEYPPALMEKISNVLTDAELFESYNKPQSAVAPLESVLEKAPRDVRINQHLLSVYQRLGRIADAAKCCATLKSIYAEAGMEAEAHQYGDMAARLAQEAGIATPEPVAAPAAEMPVEAPVSESFGATEFAVAAPEPVVAEIGEAHEIDLSSEWEAAVAEPEAEPIAPAPVPEVPVAEAQVAAPVAEGAEVEVEEEVHPSAVSDLIEEIRFYLGQQMWDEAKTAIARCEKIAPANFELPELKQQLEAGMAGVPVVDVAQIEVDMAEAGFTEDAPEEGTVAEYDFESAMAAEAEAAAAEQVKSAEVVEAAPTVEEFSFGELSTAEPVVEAAPEPQAELVSQVAEPAPVVAEVAGSEFAAPSEEAMGWDEVEGPAEAVAEVAAPAPVVAEPEPVVTAVAPAEEVDVLSDMVLDLESSLPADFGAVAAEPKPAIAAAAVAAVSTPAPVAPPSFEIGASIAPAVAPSVPVPATAVAVAAPHVAGEENSVLSDLFEEFKEEVGEPADDLEDPETHYNLGVAFKEMGLLDEAIGELQKVCRAIDAGKEFSQQMQAYTWLANCFVEKGVPEAGIKWFQKALTIPSSEESRTALHYDIACAFEAAGDRTQALKHFTEVYGTNIDYRDVAERIKSLKS